MIRNLGRNVQALGNQCAKNEGVALEAKLLLACLCSLVGGIGPELVANPEDKFSILKESSNAYSKQFATKA